MKRFEHINYEMRKIIASYVAKGKKAKEIAEDLCVDISAVSKELKRNRVVSKEAYTNSLDPICKNTLRSHMYVMVVALSILAIRNNINMMSKELKNSLIIG